MKPFRRVFPFLAAAALLGRPAPSGAQAEQPADTKTVEETFDLRLVDASPAARVGESDIKVKTLFLSGGMRLGAYLDIYPGIDVTSYGDDYAFEYIFTLHRGADPALIGLMFDHGRIAETTPDGHIVHEGSQVEIYQRKPVAYLRRENGDFEVPADYRLAGGNLVKIDVARDQLPGLEPLNGTTFNRVTAGEQPEGPEYDFYCAKFETSNRQFIRFLNDAQQNPKNPRGANMFFDEAGNVWLSPAMQPQRDEMFLIANSRIVYNPDRPIGYRYENIKIEGDELFADHPAVGVSWYGSVKYCNWLTIHAGRGEAQRCYTEGTNAPAWAPVTATNWARGQFSAAERELWLAYRGFRLPMLNCDIGAINTNRFNEIYKAATWWANTNMQFGFGRNQATPLDANFEETRVVTGTTPAGFFDGQNYLGDTRTHPSRNYYGLQDLTGNACEWITDFAGLREPDSRAVYGGSYVQSVFTVRDALALPPHTSDFAGGFRAVTTFMPDEQLVIHVLYTFHVKGEEGIPTAEAAAPEEGEEPTGEAGLERPAGEAWGEEGRRLEVLDIERTDGLYYKPFQPPPREPPAPGVGPARPTVPPVVPRPPVVPPRNPTVLKAESLNPPEGILITTAPADYAGQGSGQTSFERIYEAGTTVTLTAPAIAPNGNYFLYWQRDGAYFSGSRQVTLVMDANTTMTAVYGDTPPITHTLRVESLNPDNGVTIGVSPIDNQDLTSGSTAFEREYNRGSRVTLTAPPIAPNGNYFRYWLVDGVRYSANQIITITLNANTVVTAVYDPAPPIIRQLTVRSTDPNSGVAIRVDPADINERANGSTEFQRLYPDGTEVTLTAPPRASNGNYFQYWTIDGVVYSGNLEVSVLMNRNVEIVAVYAAEPPQTHTLTVRSRDPDTGVGIEVAPRDVATLGNGVTEFQRVYTHGTQVTLIAPESAPGGNLFQHWERDGVIISGNREIRVDMLTDVEVTAVYAITPPPAYRLVVESQNPDDGVPILVSPSDNLGMANGVTSFDRLFNAGVTVTLTAPEAAPGGNLFQHWLVNGVIYSGNLSIDILMTADTTVTAVYAPTPPRTYTLRVESTNPDSGVPITVTPADTNNLAGGTTPFERIYREGSLVNAVAPEIAPNGHVFQYWERDGVFFSANREVSVEMNADTTLNAVYAPQPPDIVTLTVKSRNPDSGVAITVSPAATNGLANGRTTFQRDYAVNTTVTLTAPPVATNGFTFRYWEVDGAVYSANQTISLTLATDTTVTAVYEEVPPPVFRLTVQSSNPDSGVPISVTPLDIHGQGNGTTAFTRDYYGGTEVTLTAPPTAGGNVFLGWYVDGVFYSANNSIQLVMSANITVRAAYGPEPPPTRVLTVTSTNPDSGVTISVSPAATNGLSTGSTPFTRVYNDGVTVTLNAPLTAPDGNFFQYWELDGVFYSANTQITVDMFADHVVNAVYAPAPPEIVTLTVDSRNPDSGVGITVTPAATNGLANGVTTFQRDYAVGTDVTLTAPTVATNGYFFQHWLLDGAIYSANPQVTVQLENDTTMTAVYAPAPPVPYTLIVRSVNPDADVPITVTPLDINGLASGLTEFSRTYNAGQLVTLSCPPTAGGNTFQGWYIDGVFFSANTTIEILMTANRTVTAVYTTEPPLTHVLRVESTNPDSGVTVFVSPAGTNGLANGVTGFERTYFDGTTVTLIAPAVAPDGNVFQYWEIDGVFYSANRDVTVDMFADHTMNAVYAPVPPQIVTLTVESQNPDAGVPIIISPRDTNSLANGSTPFSRDYPIGTLVTMTAPQVAPNGFYFQHWLLDGVIYSGNLTIERTLLADTTVTAVYAENPPPTYTLSVQSLNPDADVPIQVTPLDNNGQGGGLTGFDRTYNEGAVVRLTAPETAPNGNYFQYWMVDGIIVSANFAIDVEMFANHTAVAVYAEQPPIPRILTVTSTNPDSGVGITVTPSDNNSLDSGETEFQRIYNDNTVVTLTAPAQAETNFFLYWEQDGTYLSANREVSITMTTNITMNAVFGPVAPDQVTLIVDSQNPDGGVPIAVAPLDNANLGNGTTEFERTYNRGTQVSLEAPPTAGTNVFQRWELDGDFYSANQAVTVSLTNDLTRMTAIYGAEPPPTFILTVESRTPDSGVGIQVAPVDVNGFSGGLTTFEREYNEGVLVTLTAPVVAPNGYNFQYWEVDGVIVTPSNVLQVTMNQNTTVTAVYDEGPPSPWL